MQQLLANSVEPGDDRDRRQRLLRRAAVRYGQALRVATSCGWKKRGAILTPDELRSAVDNTARRCWRWCMPKRRPAREEPLEGSATCVMVRLPAAGGHGDVWVVSVCRRQGIDTSPQRSESASRLSTGIAPLTFGPVLSTS